MKDIVGYEGLYAATQEGRIWSYDKTAGNGTRVKGHWMSLFKNGSGPGRGYMTVGLKKQGAGKTHAVHRLIAKVFLPNPDALPEVNHINGDKTDNTVLNLEWCSRSQNILHSYRTKIRPIVARKLKPRDIPKIKQLLRNGASTVQVAQKYSVSHSLISMIHAGKRWAHVS